MVEHRYVLSRTKRPLEAGLRVLECRALYVGPPHRYSPVERRGELTGIAGDRVYILWDGDAEPTIHNRRDLYAWDTAIASYRQTGAHLTIVTRFEED